MTTIADVDALIDELTVDAHDDEEQLLGLQCGAEEALRPGERATIAGATIEIMAIDCGPDARTGLLASVRRDGATHEVAFADLVCDAGSELGLVVAAYRHWQGRGYRV